MEYLSKNDEKSIYTGLQGLYALSARYEFELDEDREPLHHIIRQSYDKLGQLVNTMIVNKENQDALYMMHLVCKVFYVSNQLQVSPFLMEDQHMDPWVQFFKTILDMPAPEELKTATDNNEEINSRNKNIFWKIKGICSKLTYRMMVKYGNPEIVEDKEHIKAFSVNLNQKFVLPLMESHLQQLMSRKTNFVGSKALSFSIKVLSYCTKHENTMEKLKPFIENIMFDTIVPIMYITERDINTLNDDPIEFIRNQYDFTETLFLPKNCVQDLLIYICKYKEDKKKKTKPEFLQKFLGFAVQNLNQYNDAIQTSSGADWRIKEALMYCIGTLSDEING